MSIVDVLLGSSRATIAYGAINGAISLLHCVFILYYVVVYRQVYHITDWAFYVCQLVYLVWNSINDPLFGALSDLSGARDGRRVRALRLGGPLFAFAFLLPWYPWWTEVGQESVNLLGLFPVSYSTAVAWHFLVSLCVYDGLFTYVYLAHCALLADQSIETSDRTAATMWNAVFGVVAAISVYYSHAYWDPNNMEGFQSFACFLAATSAVVITCCVPFLRERPALTRAQDEMAGGDGMKQERKGIQFLGQGDKDRPSLLELGKQLLSRQSYLTFVSMNFFQVFICAFTTNFFPIFLNAALGNSTSARSTVSFVVMLSFVLPHLSTVYLSSLAQHLGAYGVISGLFAIRAAFAAIAYLSGPASFAVVILFLLTNRILTENTCRLLGLVIADLVDEDQVVAKRKVTLGGMIHGINALLTKPAQSFAPMLGWYLLSHDSWKPDDPMVTSGGVGSDSDSAERARHIFAVVTAVSFFVAAFQIAVWMLFPLKGGTLKVIRTSLAEREIDV